MVGIRLRIMPRATRLDVFRTASWVLSHGNEFRESYSLSVQSTDGSPQTNGMGGETSSHQFKGDIQMRKRIFSVGFAVATFWSTAIVLAQEQAPAPSFKDGDTWQFNIAR